MDWFYASNGQQKGPVSDVQLDELVRTSVINHETLVWHAGLADWQPLRAARSSGPPPVPVPGAAPEAVCVECGRMFPQGEMVFLSQSWVCGPCKPMFLQRLKEGGAPQTAVGSIWRFNKQMVLRSETPMPDRCVRCNAPANGFKLKRQLYWHPPLVYLLVLINLLVYLAVALSIRKKALLHVGLCETHRTARKRAIIGTWLSVLTGIAMIIGGIAWNSVILGLLGVVLFLGGLIVGLYKARIVSPTKINKEYAWVKGAGEPFLAELPEWTGPAN
jgi:hypothetical protein